MRIGICIEETWDFFKEIYEDLSEYHQTSLFKRRELQIPFFRERTNRYIFNRGLRSFMAKNDVVFFEWASHLLAAATHLPKTCSIVTRLHRYEMYQWMDQVDWDNVDKIILVTRSKQNEFIRRFPEQAKKTVVIYESVSLDKFSFQSKPHGGDIGILCHLTPRKRVYELILDFYNLTKKNEMFHLHIGGDPHPSFADYLEAMRLLIKDLEIEDRVTFYGPVHNTFEWYRKIDIFISNSYSEGLQVALVEAMASGCFCLSHHWAGVDELLPMEHLFYTGSEFQEKVLAFSDKSGEEKLKLKAQMRNIVEKQCNINHTKTQIRQLIEEIGMQTKKL